MEFFLGALIGFALTAIIAYYLLEEEKDSFRKLENDFKHSVSRFHNLKEQCEVLETSVLVSKDKVRQLKNELVTEKAINFNYQTVIQVLEHENLLRNEELSRAINDKHSGIFYDQTNDVIVAGKDLVNIGEL